MSRLSLNPMAGEPVERPPKTSTVIGMWEGVVTELPDEQSIVARVVDMLRGDRLEETAEFDVDEVSEGDRSLLRVGALFYLTVYREPGDRRRRFSEVRLRRLPPIRVSERDEAWADASLGLFMDPADVEPTEA